MRMFLFFCYVEYSAKVDLPPATENFRQIDNKQFFIDACVIRRATARPEKFLQIIR